LLLAAIPLCAQTQESARDWAALIGNRYTLRRDIVYKTVNGFEAKVDVYMPLNDPKPRTTMLYIHGGGWRTGSKEQYLLFFVPYIQMGMKVISVQYRLAGVAPAPAAVEDARCAFRWLYQNAGTFGFDTGRIVVSGGSAGGHLALLTAMMEASAGFDSSCPEGEPMRAAAIINYYGAVDLVEPYQKEKGSVFDWLGEKGKLDLARRLSPAAYVRPGLPPVLTIHGDADQAVPYAPTVRFHEALDRAKVPNRLVTIPGGAHGRHTWPEREMMRAHAAIEEFLQAHKLLPAN
jgi:acetyl esterase/lipase